MASLAEFGGIRNGSEAILELDIPECPLPLPPLYTTLEFFKCSTVHAFANSYWLSTWVLVAVYLASIQIATRLMARRGKAFRLKTALFVWNTGLAVFSILFTWKMHPTILLVFQKGLKYALLHDGYFECNMGYCLWTLLFVLSKIVELGDTAFIILRGRKVTFLHAYHHSTVLLFVWWLAKTTPTGLAPQYMIINSTVHTFMYSYYACKARGIQVPRTLAKVLTFVQISQMFYGVWVTYALYVYTMDTGMPFHLKVALWIYASYAVLFVNFFVQTYFRKNKKRQ